MVFPLIQAPAGIFGIFTITNFSYSETTCMTEREKYERRKCLAITTTIRKGRNIATKKLQ